MRSEDHCAHVPLRPSCRDEDFEASAAKISAGVAYILHTLLDGYLPDVDAHPGVGTAHHRSAEVGDRLSAPGGCIAAVAALPAAAPPAPPMAMCGSQQPQASRPLAYRALVVPSDGFGTGRARLHTDAPRTFDFLKRQVCSVQPWMSMLMVCVVPHMLVNLRLNVDA
jgi:hypothetical protein